MVREAKKRNQVIKIALLLSYNLCLFPAAHGVLPIGILQFIGVLTGKIDGENIFVISIASLMVSFLSLGLILVKKNGDKLGLITVLLMVIILFVFMILLGGAVITYLTSSVFVVVAVLYFRKLIVGLKNKTEVS